MNLGGGGRGGAEPSHDGKHRSLKIGTESRVQIANALGKELHYPLMSKLWDSKTGPTDRDTYAYMNTLIYNGNIFLVTVYFPLIFVGYR